MQAHDNLLFFQRSSPNSRPQTTQHRTKTPTHNLGLPSTLHQGPPPPILGHGLHIIGEAIGQAGETQDPEQQADGQGQLFLNVGGLVLEVEGDHDGDGDDGHVDAETEP